MVAYAPRSEASGRIRTGHGRQSGIRPSLSGGSYALVDDKHTSDGRAEKLEESPC